MVGHVPCPTTNRETEHKSGSSDTAVRRSEKETVSQQTMKSTIAPTVAPDSATADSGEGFLRLENLTKMYTDRAAVRGLDISISKGEFVAFLGPSGCGKTTTLRMIAGFIKNDAGSIHLDGKRIDTLLSRRRGTAMVFQDYALFPNMTIFDNIAFGLQMRKIGKAEIKQRVAEVLEVVQLVNVESKYPKELSGGMRQRVALARAIVVRPRVLLLDEPLSNLDTKLRKSVRNDLREIHDRLGITTVLVTHDLEEAFSLGDRVVVMNAGQLEQYGTPREIYSHPANTFVADFVGHTNLIDGRWSSRAGGCGLFEGAGLSLVTTRAPESARAAVYSIPPNAVRISFGAERPEGDNVVSGVVQDASFLGSLYGLRIAAGEGLLNVSVVTGSIDDSELVAGRQVWLHWNAAEGDCV